MEKPPQKEMGSGMREIGVDKLDAETREILGSFDEEARKHPLVIDNQGVIRFMPDPAVLREDKEGRIDLNQAKRDLQERKLSAQEYLAQARNLGVSFQYYEDLLASNREIFDRLRPAHLIEYKENVDGVQGTFKDARGVAHSIEEVTVKGERCIRLGKILLTEDMADELSLHLEWFTSKEGPFEEPISK